MATSSSTILVDVRNGDGVSVGRTIPVTVTWSIDVDKTYGADADGNRGVSVAEANILDCEIDTCDLLTLRSDQVEMLLQDARRIFWAGIERWIDPWLVRC